LEELFEIDRQKLRAPRKISCGKATALHLGLDGSYRHTEKICDVLNGEGAPHWEPLVGENGFKQWVLRGFRGIIGHWSIPFLLCSGLHASQTDS